MKTASLHYTRRQLSVIATFSLALAYGGGLWMLLLHELEGGHEQNAPSLLLHWLRDSSLALPLVSLAVSAALLLTAALVAHAKRNNLRVWTGGITAAMVALFTSFAVAAASPLHGFLFEAHHGGHGMPWYQHIARDMLLALVVNLPLAGAVAALHGPTLRAKRQIGRALNCRRQWRGLSVRMATSTATAAVLLSSLLPAPQLATTTAQAATMQCDATATIDRSYDVAAVNVTIPYNRWGDTDPNGMIYVLQSDQQAVKNWSLPLNVDPDQDPAGNRRLRPRPLVLRANAGDCVKVTLTNELNTRQWGGELQNPRVSIHAVGLAYNVQTADGSAVGFNADSTVGIGQSITSYWRAPEEGLYFFRDQANPAGSEADGGSVVHGLFGALAVEPAGSTWRDPVSGNLLYSKTGGQSGELYIDAMIQPPTGAAFRESIQLAQDEIPGIGFGFNYGAENGENREHHRCADCIGEETSLSSWVYGDPGLVKLASGPGPWLPQETAEDCGLSGSCWTSNVSHAYPKDRTKIRFGMSGVKETHVFHMHAHQWRVEPNDPQSTIIDSQTFGPGEMFTADLIGGAGSNPGTIGDSIFHCHLYPHFAAGMWALFRVHDVHENGSTRTPDGVNVLALQPLPGKLAPNDPTAQNPGFPRFIPGKFGWRPPQPPNTVFNPSGTPDDPATLNREDLVAAARIVAGKELDAAKVALEEAVQKRYYPDREPVPGAPLIDPCPSTARQVTYNVTVLQRDIVYNEAGWHDTQARIYVLTKDVDAILAGTKAPEPLFIRVNAGDCINFNLTNMMPNWYGNDAFVELGQSNMVGGHIHLVKFDVLGSDGSTNGWNYNQAAFSREQADFNAELLTGTKACTTNEAVGACRIAMNTAYDPTTQSTRAIEGQTISERWYADSELRTVFSHDHHFAAAYQNRGLFQALIVEPTGLDMRNPFTGEFYQPGSGKVSGAPTCGTSCEGNAAGAFMDIIGPGTNDDFREYGLAFQDFVSLTRAGGDPRHADDTLNPPHAPELLPDEDPGIMGINYRNAPFLLRDTKNGAWVDPAYRFSSTVFGDPKTPLLQAYAGDPVRIRLIQGSQEEQHAFMMHGMRWRQEPDDSNSQLVNAQAIGISEAFNFEIPRMECGLDEDCRGDYLYSSTSTDATYLGMWGIMRVYGKGVQGLLPLPDNRPQAANGNTNFSVTGSPPAKANKPGTPCPVNAPVRSYNVVALEARMTYNQAGDMDPYGLMYALIQPGETLKQAVTRARQRPEPLVIRANEGDCLEVTLTNVLSSAFLNHGGAADGDPKLPLEAPTGTRAGLRVSLHPQLVRYDVRYSDGATVGFNRDQTVSPGETIMYRWWVDDVTPGELGATNLLDNGDLRGHRHHGLFAGLNIEPKGATYHDPFTGAQILSGVSADIRVPGMKDFREFTTFFQDGLNLRDENGAIIHDPSAHPGVDAALDAEDSGEKGFNYASAPFRHRLGSEPVQATPTNPLDGAALAHVFDSTLHGDPSTPIFRAYAGDTVRMRVLQGSDKPRQHAFQLASHAWRAQPEDAESNWIGTQGGFTVGRAANIHLPSAGEAGDYQYTCGVFFHHQSGGLWGIMRVYDRPAAQATFRPSALGSGKGALTGDNPYRTNNHPIMPLEQSTITAHIFDDSNMDRQRSANEATIAGATVHLKAIDGTIITSRKTGDDGKASFQVAHGAYDLEVANTPDWAPTTATTLRIDATEPNVHVNNDFGRVQLADVAIRSYDDKNGSQTLDAGEAGKSGWTVTLTGGGTTQTATTDANGVAQFKDLKPGSYSANVAPSAGWVATQATPVAFSVTENASLQPATNNDVRIGYALKAGLSTKLFNDSNGNGAQDAGESNLAGWSITATGGPAGLQSSVTGVTDANGNLTFSGLQPGPYTLKETLPADWSCASASTKTTAADGAVTTTPAAACAGGSFATTLIADSSQVVTLANRNPNMWITVAPFNDTNNDGSQGTRESKLVGWTANVYASGGTTILKTAPVGNNGQVTFYPLTPGTYDVEFVAPPLSDANEPGWTPTPGNSTNKTRISVIAGETGTVRKGFVQLGAVTAVVFDDLDKDGVWDDNERPLANRNLKLWDSKGTTLVAQGVTSGAGRYAFKAASGTVYQLEAMVPTGWTATTSAKVQVTGPTSTTSTETWFAQYGVNDTTPPPAPTANPRGGSFTTAQSVLLTSETGATIRYTLNGSTPTATYGTLYAGPISITSSKTLKAVAMDAANNVSALTTEIYNVTLSGGTATGAASRVTMTKGTVASGTATQLALDDQAYLAINSALASGKYTADWYGAYTVPTGQRNMTGLTINYDGGASVTGYNRAVSLFNFQTNAWETVGTNAQSTADLKTTFAVTGDPKRFMSTTGELRMRVAATHTASFQLKADLMSFTVSYQ